jgi:hypothetical protein
MMSIYTKYENSLAKLEMDRFARGPFFISGFVVTCLLTALFLGFLATFLCCLAVANQVSELLAIFLPFFAMARYDSL